MDMLPPVPTLPCVAPYAQPEPTHVAMVRVHPWTGHAHNELLGTITFHPSEWNDSRSRLARIRERLGGLTIRWQFDTYPIDEFSLLPREARRLTDVQRFRRKMGQVLRAYDEQRAVILTQSKGLFVEDDLARLDAELEEAWGKAERIYQCTREDFKPTTTPVP